MSFTGDLAQLPIVDIIQLIHSTRKSGTLSIQSQKGKSQLAFSDGYFVSANHLNSSIRVGRILVENGFLSSETLDRALEEQKYGDTPHRPLVRILIEQGRIKPEDAYRCLETLIEMTIVEALTWTNGTFSMDLNQTDIDDEFRYFPESLHQEILLNAQQILMDALRIYDEKMRDGRLENIFFAVGSVEEKMYSTPVEGEIIITADLLGLDALDAIPLKKPDHSFRLDDKDEAEEHRRIIADELYLLPAQSQDDLCSFLVQTSRMTLLGKQAFQPGARSLAIIMFSHDLFMKHALSSICRSRNHIIFTTDDDISLDLFIDQSFSHGHQPVLVVDDPVYIGEGYEERTALMLREKREKYPLIAILQLKTCLDMEIPQPQELEESTMVMMLRPVLSDCLDTFTPKMTGFLTAFRSILEKSFVQQGRLPARKLKECVASIMTLTEPPAVARELLIFSASLFERAVTLVVGAEELTAEKGIGIAADKNSGPSGPLMFKIPRGTQSVLDDVIEHRRLFYGNCTDPVFSNYLYNIISSPGSPRILLLPLILSGKVIALIYADFGQTVPAPVLTDHLEIVSCVASLVLEKTCYQKRFDVITKALNG